MSHATLSASELERRIVHDAEGVVVVDKPWGLPSTGRRLNCPDSLQYALVQRHVAMVWAVHQLDADTTGLNVFVTRRHLVPRWQERMRFPRGEKTYLAVVHGEPEVGGSEWQVVDAPIGVVREEPSRCLGVAAGGRPARTRLRVLAARGGFSALELRLETGRTHQVRIHLASIGHPLVGERWYREAPCTAHPRQALHAWRLRFADAIRPGELVAALPDDLRGLLDRLGFDVPIVPADRSCNGEGRP
jgi:23S rRNA-/tRNA-specific pseudouridylate synthase